MRTNVLFSGVALLAGMTCFAATDDQKSDPQPDAKSNTEVVAVPTGRPENSKHSEDEDAIREADVLFAKAYEAGGGSGHARSGGGSGAHAGGGVHAGGGGGKPAGGGGGMHAPAVGGPRHIGGNGGGVHNNGTGGGVHLAQRPVTNHIPSNPHPNPGSIRSGIPHLPVQGNHGIGNRAGVPGGLTGNKAGPGNIGINGRHNAHLLVHGTRHAMTDLRSVLI